MVLARPVCAFGLVLDVLAQQGRVGFHRLGWIDQGRQVIVVDLDQLDAVGRRIAVRGDDEGNLLVLEQHLLVCQHGLHVAGQGRHVVQVQWDQVLGGDDREHAGDGQGRLLVDALDAGMAVRRAHEVAEQHAGQLDVVDVVALALGKAGVFHALAGAAEAFELLGAFAGQRGLLVHSAASERT